MPRNAWLERWKAKMLNVPAFHIVFTVPQELVALWRMNQQAFANVLFLACQESFVTLLADDQWLGATPGLLGALHTWSQTLAGHPHCHFIVTCGGVAADGTWNVKLLERYEHASGVAIYLANYLRGGPISNSRLISLRSGRVRFRYLDRRDGKPPRSCIGELDVNTFLG